MPSFRRSADLQGRRLRLSPSWRRALDVPGVAQVRSSGREPYAVHVQDKPDGAGRARHRAGRRAQRDRAGDASTRPREPEGSTDLTLDTNDQLFDARASQGHRRLSQRRAGQAPGRRRSGQRGAERRTGAWYDGKPAELLLIQREAGANTIAVVDHQGPDPTSQESMPPTVHVDLVSDRSQTIRASVTTCSSR